MIRIRVFPDQQYIQCSSEKAMINYRNVCGLNNDCSYMGKFILVDDDSYTHAILLNKAQPKLNISKNNVIGMAFEPNQLLQWNTLDYEYLKKNVSKYYASDIPKGAPELFISHYTYMWHCQMRAERYIQYKKKHTMSYFVSNRLFLPGHIYRMHLAAKIIRDTDMDVHFYGSGCDLFQVKDQRIKGKFADYEIYKEYRYTVAICNYQTESLVTEKYTDPISFNCIPIYYGATTVETYFGSECCVKLTGDVDEDIRIITEVYNNPGKYNYNLTMAKHELYEGYCYFPTAICREFIDT